MYLKLHENDAGKSVIAALCDKELLGKVYREKELVLDLERYAAFYKGEITGEEEAARALKKAVSMNLVGRRSVGLALKLGLAGKGEVRKISGIPHLQIYRI